MKYIGIEVGTFKSCMAYEEANDIKIIPNSLGERIFPSVVSIKKNKILAAEDASISKISNFNHTISEFKRILGVNYRKDNLNYENYKKYLSYDLIEKEDEPLLIKIDNDKFTPEEIYAYIIKKIIDNGKNNEIYITKAMFTIPACFGILKRKLIKKAAKLAGINLSNIHLINESYASALAFEIYINKANEKLKYKYNYEIFLAKNKNRIVEDDASSPVSLINNSNKLTIVLDLGGGCFDLTLLSIEQKDGILDFDIKASLGDPNFGCVDFDNKLVDYCINEFCQIVKIKEDDIYKDKKAIQRLKFKCEIAKKILNKRENVVINVDNFYGNEDLCSYITRDIFDKICENLYKKITNKLDALFKMTNLTTNDISEVLLIGGSTKIPKIIKILKEKFNRTKIIYNLDKDKIVVTGAVIYESECESRKKNKTIILHDTLPLSIGISVFNNDIETYFMHGNKMHKILQKDSRLPIKSKKHFKTKIGKSKKIYLNFYEGENKYVKYNEKLYGLKVDIPGSSAGSIIEFDLTLEVDINYILKITIDIPSLEPIEIEIGKIDKNEEPKTLQKRMQTNQIDFDFSKARNELNEYAEKLEKFGDEDKNRVLINCCEICDDILKEYEDEKYYREDVIEYIFLATRDLFFNYLKRFKIKNKEINDNEDIILKIKERMKNVIKTVGYLENLLEVFKDICKVDKNIFYQIMINYIELMNNEGVNFLMKKNKTRKNYSKIYFRSCSFIVRKIEKEIDFSGMSEELNQKYEIQKNINQFALELIISREKQNKSVKFESLKNIVDSINNKKYKWLKDTLLLIEGLQRNYDTLINEN